MMSNDPGRKSPMRTGVGQRNMKKGEERGKERREGGEREREEGRRVGRREEEKGPSFQCYSIKCALPFSIEIHCMFSTSNVVMQELQLKYTTVHKITVRHWSISDHFTNMTTQIIAWSVLPSDHIFSLYNDAA